MDDLGLHHQKAHSSDVAVLVEMLAEDYGAAEREARHAYAVLAEMGDLTYQASEALLIAGALERQGRTDEAEEWLATSNAVAGSTDDPDALVVQARLAARRGRLEEAIELVRSALERGAELPVPSFSDARFTLAEILHRAGREEEAAEAAERCLQRFEAKGIVPLVQKAKALLAEIRGLTAQASAPPVGEAEASPRLRRSCGRPPCTSSPTFCYRGCQLVSIAFRAASPFA